MSNFDKRLTKLEAGKPAIRRGVLIAPWGDLRISEACRWANGDPFDPDEPYEGVLLVPETLEPEEWEAIVMKQQAEAQVRDMSKKGCPSPHEDDPKP